MSETIDELKKYFFIKDEVFNRPEVVEFINLQIGAQLEEASLNTDPSGYPDNTRFLAYTTGIYANFPSGPGTFVTLLNGYFGLISKLPNGYYSISSREFIVKDITNNNITYQVSSPIGYMGEFDPHFNSDNGYAINNIVSSAGFYYKSLSNANTEEPTNALAWENIGKVPESLPSTDDDIFDI